MPKPKETPKETTTEATEILWNYYKALSELDKGKGFSIFWFYTGKKNETDKPEPAGFKNCNSLNDLTKAFLADDDALCRLKAEDLIDIKKIEEYCNKKDSPKPNDSQKEAIRLAISNPITIVQGPPGTGKTETIKNLLICLRKHNKEAKIAMVSANNHAVENLEEKIKECDYLKDKYARLGAKYRRKNFAKDYKAYDFIDDAFKDDYRFKSDLLGKFPIILSTIHSLRQCVNFDNQFDYVIVDECSQVSTRLGLLAMASAKHLVLFGDEKQLSPIHKKIDEDSDDNSKLIEDVKKSGEYYLDINDNSFMHACSERFGDTAAKIMLNEHYRCHPKIIDFCNQIFYGGDLKIKTQGKGFPIRIRWYEGDYWERIYENKDEQNSSQDSTSDYKPNNYNMYNMKQIEIFVEEELPLIIEKYIKNSEYSMCVLSPYKAQIKKLKEKLSDGETLKSLYDKIGLTTDELNELLNGEDESDEVCDFHSWSLSTVHKAQGKEYDYVCVMPVVDDTSETWTWHQSARITNVAISRAKKELCYIMSANWMPKATQEEIMDEHTESLFDGIEPIIQDPPNYEEQTGKEQEIGYLRKLVEYIKENKNEWEGSDYGLKRTGIHSIFDIDYILRKTYGLKKTFGDNYNSMSAPELSLFEILNDRKKNDGLLKDIFLHYNMRLGDKDGNSNVEGMKIDDDAKEYIKYAHFDFVLTRGDDDKDNNGKIALIIEVDGAEHRGVTDFDRSGNKFNNQQKNDRKKNSLVKTIGKEFYNGRFLRLPTDGTTRDEIEQIIKKIKKADKNKVIQPEFKENLEAKIFDRLKLKLYTVFWDFQKNDIIKDFRRKIAENPKEAFDYLHDKKISLNFDVKGNSMNYTDELTCQQYMIRYTMAYAFEYYVMYRIALNQLGESPRVYSFGCGSGLDCLSLAYAKEVKLNYDKEVSYRGIDLTKWAENFDLNNLPGVDAKTHVDKEKGMLAFLKKEPDYMPNILFFPKILSEIDEDEVIKPFCELLKDNSDKLSDELIVCVSYRGGNTSKDDLEKTNQIIKALKVNYKLDMRNDVISEIEIPLELIDEDNGIFKFKCEKKEDKKKEKKIQYRTIDENFSIPKVIWEYAGFPGIKSICVNAKDEIAVCKDDAEEEIKACKECKFQDQCPKSAIKYVKDMCFQIIHLKKE